jgi:membrane-associated phospholipid phosphatase
MASVVPASELRRPGLAEKLVPRGPLAWWAWASLVVFPGILLAQATLLGLRPDHIGLVSVFLILSWLGPKARAYVVMGSPMWLAGIGYDFLRLITHLRPEVHVDSLWNAERSLFGFQGASGPTDLGEWIATHTHPVLDAVTGGVYILYLPFPIILASLLYFRHEPVARRLSISFGVTSVLGWAIWLAWPAAPPWYVDTYGLGPAQLDALPSAAGTIRFDQLFGVHLFQSFYEKSHNVFGAMPSLHAGYGAVPALAVWQLRGKLPALSYGCALWAMLMAFAAVYLRHHYILDVLAGVAVAITGDTTARFLLRRHSRSGPASVPKELAQ